MSADQTFADACSRYDVRRAEARMQTKASLKQLAYIQSAPTAFLRADLSEITDACLAESDDWKLPWRRIVGQFRPYVRRFDLALWHDGTLHGLAIGRASRGDENVTVHYMERNGSNTKFRGWLLPVTIDAADNYAKLLGRQWVKVKNPVLPLVPRYETLGFELAEPIRGSAYLRRRVT